MEVRQTLGGRYTLLTELGSGGMAVVWRAHDTVLGRLVAVKLLAGRFAGDPQSRSRIRDEARAAATLSHPNIAQVYDYGESTEGGTPVPYVVMELINGPTLQQRVADGPLPARTVFRICGEVAAGLAAAHADGLVHRDIKMANIMVTAGGAKVVDFGIAAAAGPAEPGELLVGTPAYLAPERMTGSAVQPASDVYALGVLLFRLLAGKPPWSVESTTQMIEAHVYLPPDPLPERPGVPRTVTDLVARCLRKDPAGRPSAAEVSAVLGDAAEAAQSDHVPGPLAATDAPTGDFRATPPRANTYGDPVTSDLRAVSPANDRGPAPADGDATGPTTDAIQPLSLPVPVESDGRAGASAEPIGGPNEPSDRAGASAEPIGGPREPGGAEPGRSGAVAAGADSVRRRKRKRLVAAGAAVALIVAGLAGWLALGDPEASVGGQAAVLPPPVATPARSGSTVLPRASAPAGGTGSMATRRPGRSADAAGSPAPSRSRAGSAGPVAAPTSPAEVTKPEPTATATTSPATSPPPAQGTRLTTPGGSVDADCGPDGAMLSGPDPAPGFEVEDVESGPALAAEIVFADGLERYRMTVTCVDGVPTPVVLPL